jgi:hypothetical protein
MDVVYNHFGPEGNYLPAFTSGKVFNPAHQTPWGAAVNYDGEGSAAMRELVVQNAVHWAVEYHVDGPAPGRHARHHGRLPAPRASPRWRSGRAPPSPAATSC